MNNKSIDKNYKHIFTNIYDNQIWNEGNPNIPLSGPGSSLRTSKKFVEFLNEIVDTLHIKSIVDIGCGDLTWMPTMKYFKNIDYTGLDIVESVINTHKLNYKGDKKKQFIVANAVEDNLPGGDLVIIRDVLFHLGIDDVQKILKKINGKYKYYLITSSKTDINSDNFNKYHFRPLNISIAPFFKNRYFSYLDEAPAKRNVLLFDKEGFK